jgi:hypothetical protein
LTPSRPMAVALLVLAAPAGCDCFRDCPDSPGDVRCEFSCVDLETSTLHCGDCGQACSGDESCVQGECVCNYGLCDGVCTNAFNDPMHCGDCSTVCRDPTPHCHGRQCLCLAPQAICDGECTNLRGNENHCGSCDIACSPTSTCFDGECVDWTATDCDPPCPVQTGQACCATPEGSRCAEIGLDDDHCGTCGRQCDDREYCCDGECEVPAY